MERTETSTPRNDDTRQLLAKIMAEINSLHEKIDRVQASANVVSPGISGTFEQSVVQPSATTIGSTILSSGPSMRSDRLKSSGHGSTWRTVVKKNFGPSGRTQSLHRAGNPFRSNVADRQSTPDSARSVSPVVASGDSAGILQKSDYHHHHSSKPPPILKVGPTVEMNSSSPTEEAPTTPTLLQPSPNFGDSALNPTSNLLSSFEVSEGGVRRRKRLPSTVEHIPSNVSQKLQHKSHSTWRHHLNVMFKYLTTLSIDPNSTVSIVLDLLFVACTAVYIIALVWLFVNPDQYSDVFAIPSNAFIALFVVLQIETISWSLGRLFMRFKKDYEVVDDAAQIREEYLKSRWFAVDVFLCLPFDFIFLAFYPLLFYVTLIRHPLFRMIRIVKLSQSSDPLLPTSRAWILIVAFFALTVCVAHSAVCVFWRLELTDSTTDKPLTYADCLYWVMATLSSTGYGDISARYQSSRIFAIVLMLIGMAIVSATTAIVTTFLSNKDALEEEHDRMRRMMGSMLRHYSIPWQLQKDVVTLFPSVLATTSEQQFKQMIQQLPSFMEQRVESYLRAKLLRQIPLFSGLPEIDELLIKVSQKMKTIHVQPYEYIINAGDVGDEMYIIVHGTVDVLIPTGAKIFERVSHEDGTFTESEESEEKRVATLRSGSFFGEIALIEDCTRVASVLALQNCELLVLTRETFMDAVRQSPALQASLESAVKQRREAIDAQKKAVIAKMNQAVRDGSESPHGTAPRSAIVKIADHHEIVMPPKVASSESLNSVDEPTNNHGNPLSDNVLVEDVHH